MSFQSYLYGIEITHTNKWVVDLNRFQSYLYGIEMSISSSTPSAGICFNRTFMELKLWDAENMYNTPVQVSIVPLWN